MTGLWTLRALTPIGLDLGRHSIKAVQLRRAGDGLELYRALVLPRRERGTPALDPGEIERAAGVLARRGFAGDRVAICAPDDAVFGGEIETPPAGKVPLGDIVRAELARSQRVDPGSFEFAWWEVSEQASRSGAAVVAAACETGVLETGCQALEEAGLRVEAIDVPSLVLARAGELAGRTDTNELVILADVGWGATSIVVVHNGAVMYERSSEALGCGRSGRDADAFGRLLAGELEASTSYAAHRLRGAPDPAVLITGGGATPSVVSACRSAAQWDVETLTPASFARGDWDEREAVALTHAASLAGRFA